MRTLALAAIVILLVQSSSVVNAQVQLQSTPPTWQAVIKANGINGSQPSKPQYLFECHETESNGKFFKKDKKQSQHSPRLIVEADKPGKIKMLSQSPFVTGVQKVGTTGKGVDAYQPIITVLEQGHTIEVKVTQLDDLHVQLDARFEFISIDSVETVGVGGRKTQAPTNRSVMQRVVRTVRLGEPLQLKIPAYGNVQAKIFEYRVQAMGGHALAIK